MREDKVLDKDSIGGGSKKWLINGCIWKVDLVWFVYGFYVGFKIMDLNNLKDWNGKEDVLYLLFLIYFLNSWYYYYYFFNEKIGLRGGKWSV